MAGTLIYAQRGAEGFAEGCMEVCGGVHRGVHGGACRGVCEVVHEVALLFVLGYHWFALATIDLVGDNREFEV